MTYVKNHDRMQDDNLVLHDSTSNITADALATVGGAAANGIIDIGDVPVAFDVVMDFSAVDTTTGDEIYEIQVLGSDSSSFASGVKLLGVQIIGDYTQFVGGTGGIDTDNGAGRYVLTCRNFVGDGTVYRYVRLNFEVTGTTPILTPAGDIFIANVRAC